MKCDKAQEVFSDYLEGTIDPPLALALRNHLNECPDCTRAYELFSAAWRELDSMPLVKVPAGFRQRVTARVEASRVRVRRPILGVDWQSVFTARMPVRAFAAAVAMAVFALMALIIGPEAINRGPRMSQFAIGQRPSVKIYQTTETPGLQVSVNRAESGSDMVVYRIVLQPASGVRIVQPVVYVIPKWDGRLSNLQLDSNTLVFHRVLRPNEEVAVPVVIERSQFSRDSLTAYVQWTHNGEQFSSIIFLPTQQYGGLLGKTETGGEATIFYALKQLSARYAAVIATDGNMEANVAGYPMTGPIEDALKSISEAVPVTWKQIGYKTYEVKPK